MRALYARSDFAKQILFLKNNQKKTKEKKRPLDEFPPLVVFLKEKKAKKKKQVTKAKQNNNRNVCETKEDARGKLRKLRACQKCQLIYYITNILYKTIY